MNGKKIIALLLAIVMVLGLGTMASATAPNDKVQVNNMMVDASLVEAQAEETVATQAASSNEIIVPQATPFELESELTSYYSIGDNTTYAPIDDITVDWPGSEVVVRGVMQGRVVYEVKLPGAKNTDLTNRRLTFTLTNREAMTDTDTLTVTMGSNSCTTTKGGTTSMLADLAFATQNFNVAWTENGTARTSVCMIFATNDLNYPPIQKIELGSNSSINVTNDGATIQYLLHVPGGSATGTQNFKFTASAATSSGTTTYSDFVVTYGEESFSFTTGETKYITMTAVNGKYSFETTWKNKSGAVCSADCEIIIDTSKSVSLYGVRDADGNMNYDSSVIVSGATAAVSELTVGGVTRYTCAIELPENTSNTDVTVQFKLASSGATATLGGASPDSSKVSSVNKTKTVTFNNVDFSTTKELVITNGSASRTYLVSAAAAGSTVTVHIAIRTFLADEYLENRTNWYTGYGTSSVSSSEKTRLLGVASYLRGANVTNSSTTASAPSYGGNAPISKDTATGRMIFNENSYVTLTVPASYTVKDVLDSFTSNETYFPGGFYIQAAQPSYIEAMGQTSSSVMGEFDCGSASGWMYTVRTSSTDLDSALPNAAASTWPISNDIWIDWYYTAAYGMDFGYSMFG